MPERLEVVELPYCLGAEVRGVDLRSVDDRAFGDNRKVWLENLVIVIRGQQLSDDHLIRFSERFGMLDDDLRPSRDFGVSGEPHQRSAAVRRVSGVA